MTEQDSSLTRHDLEAKIVKRCWEDESFQKEFTADPKGTFVKYLAVPAVSLPKIVVHEETADSWHIVLPAKPANTNELSDQELEKVAGGVTPTIVVVPVSLIVGTATASAAVSAGSAVSVAVSINKGW